jgi:hypothetical protein
VAGNFFDQFDSSEPASAPAPARSRYADAISTVESGGNYREIGPHTGSMGRALGKYQVMSANVGPWSKEVLGREVTPQEFISDPKLQDAIFEGKFGQYVEKYGPDGAARAWFAGEKGMKNPNAKDVLGTSVAEYSRRFNKALGSDARGAVEQFGPISRKLWHSPRPTSRTSARPSQRPRTSSISLTRRRRRPAPAGRQSDRIYVSPASDAASRTTDEAKKPDRGALMPRRAAWRRASRPISAMKSAVLWKPPGQS